VPESVFLIVFGIAFGAIMNEIDRCDPQVKKKSVNAQLALEQRYKVHLQKKAWHSSANKKNASVTMKC